MDKVIIYEHANFLGKSASLPEGNYNVDQFGLPNDTLSSLQVPFGLAAELCEHKDFVGNKKSYEYGNHTYVGNDFNDLTSSIRVTNGTVLFMSTDDPLVPSSLEAMFSGIFIGVSAGLPPSGKFDPVFKLLPGDTTKRYYKYIEAKIPEGMTFKIWEVTQNGKPEGRAGWNYSYDEASRTIRIVTWVVPRQLFGTRNWIGVKTVLLPQN